MYSRMNLAESTKHFIELTDHLEANGWLKPTHMLWVSKQVASLKHAQVVIEEADRQAAKGVK